MQRSSSASRETSMYSSFRSTMDIDQHLPTCDPLSHVAQRERCRLISAQKAIHLIPLLVLLCAIILWFFSAHTPTPSDYRL